MLNCQAFVSIKNHPSTLSWTRQPLPLKRRVEVSPQRSRSLARRNLSLIPDSESVSELAKSLFNYGGNVPVWQAFGLNAFLFVVLRSKLLTVLTPTGYYHALALGTGLWTTLGWRGWTMCVAYLFLGSAVTKVRFAEKEKRGIAEGRGGRRGPENVW
jgi:hypothetical protein